MKECNICENIKCGLIHSAWPKLRQIHVRIASWTMRNRCKSYVPARDLKVGLIEVATQNNAMGVVEVLQAAEIDIERYI